MSAANPELPYPVAIEQDSLDDLVLKNVCGNSFVFLLSKTIV